jgi:hypothetical protein
VNGAAGVVVTFGDAIADPDRIRRIASVVLTDE